MSYFYWSISEYWILFPRPIPTMIFLPFRRIICGPFQMCVPTHHFLSHTIPPAVQCWNLLTQLFQSECCSWVKGWKAAWQLRPWAHSNCLFYPSVSHLTWESTEVPHLEGQSNLSLEGPRNQELGGSLQGNASASFAEVFWYYDLPLDPPFPIYHVCNWRSFKLTFERARTFHFIMHVWFLCLHALA